MLYTVLLYMHRMFISMIYRCGKPLLKMTTSVLLLGLEQQAMQIMFAPRLRTGLTSGKGSKDANGSCSLAIDLPPNKLIDCQRTAIINISSTLQNYYKLSILIYYVVCAACSYMGTWGL